MSLADLDQLWVFPGTNICFRTAARMKAAAGRNVHGAWHLSFRGHLRRFECFLFIGDYRDRREQHLRIGMEGSLKELGSRGNLTDLSKIHDGKPRSDIPHETQVMSDK